MAEQIPAHGTLRLQENPWQCGRSWVGTEGITVSVHLPGMGPNRILGPEVFDALGH